MVEVEEDAPNVLMNGTYSCEHCGGFSGCVDFLDAIMLQPFYLYRVPVHQYGEGLVIGYGDCASSLLELSIRNFSIMFSVMCTMQNGLSDRELGLCRWGLRLLDDLYLNPVLGRHILGRINTIFLYLLSVMRCGEYYNYIKSVL